MSSTDGSFLKAGKRGKRRQDEATHRFDDDSMELRKAVSFVVLTRENSKDSTPSESVDTHAHTFLVKGLPRLYLQE